MDLKKYIDTVSGDLDPMLVKVCTPPANSNNEYLYGTTPDSISHLHVLKLLGFCTCIKIFGLGKKYYTLVLHDELRCFIFCVSELHIPDSPRHCILSLKTCATSRSQATEPAN